MKWAGVRVLKASKDCCKSKARSYQGLRYPLSWVIVKLMPTLSSGHRWISRLSHRILPALLAAALTSCAGQAQAPDPAFRVSGNWFIPPSFHGNAWSQGGDGTHLPFVYEPLFLYQPADKRYIPLLGLSATVSPDRMTFKVKLRQARWHDDTPFSSADVKTSFLTYWLQGWGGSLASIETPDPETVVFKWRHPYSAIEERQMRVQRIQAPHHLFKSWSGPAETLLSKQQEISKLAPGPERSKREEALLVQKSELLQKAYTFRPESPVGTNAYRIAKVTASEMVLERFPRSWHPKVSVPEVRILRGSTNDVMWAYLLGGDVDASHAATPPDVAAQMKALNPRLRQMNLPDYLNFGYVLNRRKAPLNEPNFREAFAILLDRDRIRRIAAYDSLTSDDYHLPLMQSDTGEWLKPPFLSGLKRYHHDPQLAEALLLKSGYTRNVQGQWLLPDGQPIRLEIAVIAGYSDWVLASESASAQLTRFGLPTQVRTYDSALYFQQLRGGSFQIAAAFGIDYKMYTHPGVSLDRLFSKAGQLSKAAGLPERLNSPQGLSDLQTDVETVMSGARPTKVHAAMSRLLWLANHELPFVAMYEKKIGVFVQEGERVKNWPPPEDPVWSLTSMGLDATYAYLLSSGRLQAVEQKTP